MYLHFGKVWVDASKNVDLNTRSDQPRLAKQITYMLTQSLELNTCTCISLIGLLTYLII